MIRRAARLPHKNSTGMTARGGDVSAKGGGLRGGAGFAGGCRGGDVRVCVSAGGGLRGGEGFAGGAGKKERAPRGFPQGAASHGRPVLTGRNGESAAARRSGTHKNEEAPCRLGRGPRESSCDLLSRVRGPGTIGDVGLDFRVRDGNGYDPHSITAETNSAWNLDSLSNRQLCRSKAGPGCPRGTVEPNR